MVAIGSDAKGKVEDMHLSRYACYLVIQNADPAKVVVAFGKSFFAVQACRQAVSDAAAMAELTKSQRLLLLRYCIKHQNTDLISAVKTSGVITSQNFAIFLNHGYRGLYNVLTADGTHKRKRPKTDHFKDAVERFHIALKLPFERLDVILTDICFRQRIDDQINIVKHAVVLERLQREQTTVGSRVE